jgi:hypothetical protein
MGRIKRRQDASPWLLPPPSFLSLFGSEPRRELFLGGFLASCGCERRVAEGKRIADGRRLALP